MKHYKKKKVEKSGEILLSTQRNLTYNTEFQRVADMLLFCRFVALHI